MKKLDLFLFYVMIIFLLFFSAGYILPLQKIETSKTVFVYVNESYLHSNISAKSIIFRGVGVSANNSSTQGEFIDVNFSLVPGFGNTYLNIKEKIYGDDFQESVYLIRYCAQKYTSKSLSVHDLYISMEASVFKVYGVSSTAPLCIALAALLNDKTLKNNTTMAGKLSMDGVTILPADNLQEKIKIAESLNIQEFIVPNDQCDLAKNTTKKLKIICVNTIDEGYKHFVE
ncbi:MAG: S16 family serine protease [archaeon]